VNIYPYYHTLYGIKATLESFGYKDYYVETDDLRPGMIIVTSTEEIPKDVKFYIEDARPIATFIEYRLFISTAGKKACFCFGPPAKDCPMHGNGL
jgi:hypothetical protein